MPLKVGDFAPEFEGKDQEGKVRRLSDFKGRYIVLYFYPKDGTPGCTKEACSFRDENEKFKEIGAEVIGIIDFHESDSLICLPNIMRVIPSSLNLCLTVFEKKPKDKIRNLLNQFLPLNLERICSLHQFQSKYLLLPFAVYSEIFLISSPIGSIELSAKLIRTSIPFP